MDQNLNKKKILFILNEPLHNLTGGGVYYNQIINVLNVKYDIYFIFSTCRLIRDKDSYNKLNLNLRPLKSFFIKVLRTFTPFEFYYKNLKWFLNKKKLDIFINDHDFDKILYSLRGDSLFIAHYVNKILKKKSYGFVEDGIERERSRFNKDFVNYKSFFYSLISTSDVLFVISENMKKEYQKLNNNITVLRPYSVKVRTKSSYSKNNIKIVFAGNLYAKDELIIFLKFLEKFSKNKNVNIQFNIITNSNKIPKSEIIKINKYDWLSENNLSEILLESDFSYLPYPFTQNMSETVKIAFPSKAALYLSHDLPVIFHGPSQSSFTRFNKKYNVGICIHNNLYAEQMFNDFFENRSIYLKNCLKAHKVEFSKKSFSSKISKLI